MVESTTYSLEWASWSGQAFFWLIVAALVITWSFAVLRITFGRREKWPLLRQRSVTASDGAKPTEPGKSWFLPALVWAILVPCLLYHWLVTAPPYRCDISEKFIRLCYRAPWRNETIDTANIADIWLEDHTFRGRRGARNNFKRVILIVDGTPRTLQCSGRYRDDLVNAYLHMASILGQPADLDRPVPFDCPRHVQCLSYGKGR